jgi:hypothetical protein
MIAKLGPVPNLDDMIDDLMVKKNCLESSSEVEKSIGS